MEDMIDEGVRVGCRCCIARPGFNAIQIYFGNFESNVILKIQQEIVVKRKIVPETEAGMELRLTLQQVLELQKKFAQSHSSDTPDNLEDAKKQLEILHRQLQALKFLFSRRLLNLLGF
ncbi:hypothetical protein CVT25_013430 [Psilocybe cyanescens]|uniref:Uncharacterized protein n=1 Tax=Psilocybe cyanescens TaxID=93625 RepID=A0A409XT56_PSICY|nr:hypothetical protein CVT25_013430 [Psilocybe cyanescens]